ncbi:lipocalin family protein [Hymenobacter sp. UYCo722]|uniref:lipocalin family protein n=1 Tax=Hymenobacter sp. UYCo722 TaxID=3156335 RepID=UPI0033940D75
MNSFRYTLLALALTTISLGSCKKDSPDMPVPTTLTATQQLTTGSWRLDQVKEGGQVTGTGANIKDQYSLTFRADGSYTQKTLATSTTYPGTWMLMTNNTMLHLTDNKGTSTEYSVAALSATELRYSFTNRNGMTEERTFSAQP